MDSGPRPGWERVTRRDCSGAEPRSHWGTRGAWTGSRPVISTRRPLRRCITDRQAGPLPAKDVRVPMARAVQHRKFTLKPAAAAWIEPSGRTHSREMQRLGVRSGPDTLLDMGLHLWTTMADMSLEDAAETEHRLFLKDPC